MATWWPKPRLPQWNMITTWFGTVMPESRGERGVEDVLGPRDLDLAVVVARAEGADLVAAALDRRALTAVGVGAGEAAALLGQLQVLGASRSRARRHQRAPCSSDLAEFVVAQLHEAAAADAGGDAA